ncbi:MAG TPA: NfeD family protein [Opitutaceae bacterium]|jgi:membrane-bound serine protease (ClpP class)|nr:NfeD family protein [Opitutaceae bacterium]
MSGKFSRILLGAFAAALAIAGVHAAPPAPPKQAVVFVIPVREEIADPTFYILRRGLKDAIAQKADLVVLDMQTLGGSAATALDMMEALGKYPAATLTYVNNQAMSAGAFIAAATQEIWFAPDGVIGAAAPVTSEGQDIPDTMRLKLTSFLRAKIRAISEGKGYRGDVLSAMIDKDFELKIDDKVIKPKGELLSLTAAEATKTYGTPPQPLLAVGVAKTLDDLLAKKFGLGGYAVTRLEVTWSEQLAVWLNALSPVLIGLGLLALFIEFKTPGFGVFGAAGIALITLVFLGHFVAGFSGHEPLLFFALGAVLLALELVFFHSAGFLGVVGLLLMAGSIVWSMADLWPNEPLTFSGGAFLAPLLNLGLGTVIAVVLAVALIRFLPRGWFWDRLVIGATVSSSAQAAGGAPEAAATVGALVGRRGMAMTALRPAGQIEIDGRRYEAQAALGVIDPGTAVVVTARSDFNLIVERADA